MGSWACVIEYKYSESKYYKGREIEKRWGGIAGTHYYYKYNTYHSLQEVISIIDSEVEEEKRARQEAELWDRL